jgi:hypothetical protein
MLTGSRLFGDLSGEHGKQGHSYSMIEASNPWLLNELRQGTSFIASAVVQNTAIPD